MNIQLIRNATLKLFYGGKVFLIDPFFADKFSQPSFAGKSLNPLLDLPIPVDEILKDVDYVLISHLHPDHFDEDAIMALSKEIPVFCQPHDLSAIIQFGFKNVKSIEDLIQINNITIHRTNGLHGTGKIGELMGNVSGFVFEHKLDRTLYFTGDTIWCNLVQNALINFQPDIIICHAGGNRFFKENPIFGEAFLSDSDPVIMDAEQVVALCNYINTSIIIATHIGALDHETVTRNQLRDFALQNGITHHQLFIPLDGEILTFN